MISTKILKKMVSISILFLILNCLNKAITFNDPGKDKEIEDIIVSYRIYKDTLYPYKIYPNLDEKKSSIWEREKANISHHQMIFNHFAKIIPFKHRKGITYFSIFYPEDLQRKNLGTMSRQKEDLLDFFSLSLSFDIWKQKNIVPVYNQSNPTNTFGLDLLSYTFIHEFGHYIMGNKTQADLVFDEEKKFYKVKSKENSFSDQFFKLCKVTPPNKKECSDDYFNESVQEISKKVQEGQLTKLEAPKEINKIINKIRQECLPSKDHYVSNYAEESPYEDAAETFSHFVLEKEKPRFGNTIAKKKILLFYENPKMIEIRNDIRKNLNLK